MQKTVYICASCGYESLKWAGRCPECGVWGSLEQVVKESAPASRSSRSSAAPATVISLSSVNPARSYGRLSMEFGEFDRVLGGGLVEGEVVLLAGEPGIGKSTLLLQIAMLLAQRLPVLYVSGEESIAQLYSRLQRLELGNAEGGTPVTRASSGRGKRPGFKGATVKPTKGQDNLSVTEETDVDRIGATIRDTKPGIVFVDSVQSLSTSEVGSFPGSITQVRESGSRLTQVAKSMGIPIILVGQVTKQGVIAGPKVLEHVVDAVVHFEGDERGVYRIVRCSKNRFGTTEEVGVFEMTGAGLVEVKDPSDIFGDEHISRPGSAMSAVLKGSRTFFVEIQALTSPAVFGPPRRMPTGIPKQRLEMLCAVLSRRAKLDVANDDVFVSVIGGMKIDDPAADLAVCMAIASAKLDVPLPRTSVYLGEVGLSGEVRAVAYAERIQSEAKRRSLSVVSTGPHRSLQVIDVLQPLIT